MADARDYLNFPDVNPLSPGNGTFYNPKPKKKIIKNKKQKP